MANIYDPPYNFDFVKGLIHALKCLRTGKMPNPEKVKAFLALIPETQYDHIVELDPYNIISCKNFAIVCALLGIQTTGGTFEERCVANLLTAINDAFKRT
jgi:hypothetical protein